jgi:TolB-like protein
VLPFDNLSDDPGQRCFSDVVTEKVIADFAGDNELLIVRNSTFATCTHGLAARLTGLGCSG